MTYDTAEALRVTVDRYTDGTATALDVVEAAETWRHTAQPTDPTPVVMHYATPGEPFTACGRRGVTHITDGWRWTDCPDCLSHRPTDRDQS